MTMDQQLEGWIESEKAPLQHFVRSPMQFSRTETWKMPIAEVESPNGSPLPATAVWKSVNCDERIMAQRSNIPVSGFNDRRGFLQLYLIRPSVAHLSGIGTNQFSEDFK